MSSYYTYATTTGGAYRTVPEPRPTPPAAPSSQNPNPKPAYPVTTEALPLPPAAKSTSKESSTTTREDGSEQTLGFSRGPEDEPTTTTTRISTTTTMRDDGGGGATAGGGSGPTSLPQPERTTNVGGSSPGPTGVQPPSSPPGAQPTIGGVTLQAGSSTTFHNPSVASSTPTPAISGSVISAPMTGVVFTFAFLGALIVGLVAGFLIAKHTRLGGGGGGGRSRRQQRDDLTEQVRLLIDTIGQRNSRNVDNNPQQPYRHDRSYLDDEKFAHASVTNQGERMPLYMNGRQSVASTITAAYGGGDGETERLHPHSIPDQNHYQDWDPVNTPLMSPHSNNVPPHPTSFSRHTAVVSPPTGLPTTNRASQPEPSGAGTFLSPRVVHLPPAQLPPDVEIYGNKGEWGSLSDIGGGGGGIASRSSFADLNEFERRRPQIQEEGEGEGSLFNIEHPCHNPHVTAIME